MKRMNYWKIYFNEIMLKFFEKRPFVWGSAINGLGWHGTPYLTYLKDVNAGDILVAGGFSYIDFVGEIQERPRYIPSNFNRRDDFFYKIYGIEAENDMDIITDAIKLELEDMVSIKTKWFNTGKKLKLPNQQPIGGFQPINDQTNLTYISEIIIAI